MARKSIGYKINIFIRRIRDVTYGLITVRYIETLWDLILRISEAY